MSPAVIVWRRFPPAKRETTALGQRCHCFLPQRHNKQLASSTGSRDRDGAEFGGDVHRLSEKGRERGAEWKWSGLSAPLVSALALVWPGGGCLWCVVQERGWCVRWGAYTSGGRVCVCVHVQWPAVCAFLGVSHALCGLCIRVLVVFSRGSSAT